MIRPPPTSTLTDTLFPSTPLFRSARIVTLPRHVATQRDRRVLVLLRPVVPGHRRIDIVRPDHRVEAGRREQAENRCHDPRVVAPMQRGHLLRVLDTDPRRALRVVRIGGDRDGLPRLAGLRARLVQQPRRSEEHTSELQSLMRSSYAVFCLKQKKTKEYK